MNLGLTVEFNDSREFTVATSLNPYDRPIVALSVDRGREKSIRVSPPQSGLGRNMPL